MEESLSTSWEISIVERYSFKRANLVKELAVFGEETVQLTRLLPVQFFPILINPCHKP